jgi:hypothetical protein
MRPEQRQFSIRYAVVTVIVLLLIEADLFGPRPETLADSDFVRLVKAGKVSDLTMSSQVITGTLAGNGLEAFLPKEKLEELRKAGNGIHRFVTTRVEDPALVSVLDYTEQACRPRIATFSRAPSFSTVSTSFSAAAWRRRSSSATSRPAPRTICDGRLTWRGTWSRSTA